MEISFFPPYVDDGIPSKTSNDYTHALGYSYDYDPSLMYCAEDMTAEGEHNWWLASCDLSGGASGGPWVQAMTSLGDGSVMSINSWGYIGELGMAGPKLNNLSAQCLYSAAQFSSLIEDFMDGDAGYIENCF